VFVKSCRTMERFCHCLTRKHSEKQNGWTLLHKYRKHKELNASGDMLLDPLCSLSPEEVDNRFMGDVGAMKKDLSMNVKLFVDKTVYQMCLSVLNPPASAVTCSAHAQVSCVHVYACVCVNARPPNASPTHASARPVVCICCLST